MLILRIREHTCSSKVGLEFCFIVENQTVAREWLMTNGFHYHQPTQSPQNDYWTRDGKTAITFRKGLDGKSTLTMGAANQTLVANFMPAQEFGSVTCEIIG